jgi:hypothetical protein
MFVLGVVFHLRNRATADHAVDSRKFRNPRLGLDVETDRDIFVRMASARAAAHAFSASLGRECHPQGAQLGA